MSPPGARRLGGYVGDWMREEEGEYAFGENGALPVVGDWIVGPELALSAAKVAARWSSGERSEVGDSVLPDALGSKPCGRPNWDKSCVRRFWYLSRCQHEVGRENADAGARLGPAYPFCVMSPSYVIC